MTEKHLGFLNFGHWIHRDPVGGRPAEPDAKAARTERIHLGTGVIDLR